MRLGNRKFSIAGLIVLMGTIALLASACGTSSSQGPTDKAKDQTLKMGWATGGGADITTLDPAQCSDTSCGPMESMLFDGLVTLDKNLNVIPWAAKSWTISSDGTTYTFTLQPNQKFSDGTPVKPSDFAWSMDRSANPCLGSQLSYYLSTIKDASAFSGETCTAGQPVGAITTLVGDSIVPDDSAGTLTIKLAQPAAYFLAALTYSTSFAVEKSVVTGDDLGKDDTWLDNLAKGATGQGGSGMFYVSAWNHQGVLTLKANPNWWGKKPNFTTVDFKLFSSSDTEYSTYQTDQTLAYTDTIPVDQIAAAKSLPDYHAQATLIIGGFMMNWKIAPFDDVNARKAFCLAVNRDQLNQSIAKGTQIPNWHIVPKGMPGYNASLKGIDGAPTAGDTAKAKQYWQQYLATLGGKPVPSVTLSFNVASASQKQLAEAYQATWKELFPEANVTISTVAWAQQVQTLFGHTMQLGRFGWLADYPDPQDFLSLLYETGAPNDYFVASVPQADALMKQADAIFDDSQQAQRMSLYNQAEQLLVDNVAVCPMFTGNGHYRLRTWVKGGYVIAPNGNVPNPGWISGYIAKH
jgi:peptide/nickel transport system substrate-binding protein/oligopeptide transport system substrate-binding protein